MKFRLCIKNYGILQLGELNNLRFIRIIGVVVAFPLTMGILVHVLARSTWTTDTCPEESTTTKITLLRNKHEIAKVVTSVQFVTVRELINKTPDYEFHTAV